MDAITWRRLFDTNEYWQDKNQFKELLSDGLSGGVVKNPLLPGSDFLNPNPYGLMPGEITESRRLSLPSSDGREGFISFNGSKAKPAL